MKQWKELNLFPFYDLKGMEDHLEKMGKKGWRLEKAGTFIWSFHKAESEDHRYAVCWSGEAESYEPKGNAPGTFRQHAEQQGYHCTLSSDRLQVYETEKNNGEQLSVSPYDRIMGIQQAARPFLFLYGTIIGLGLLSLMLLIFKIRIMPVAALASGFSLIVPVVLALLACYFLSNMILYFVWKNKAEIAATKKQYENLSVPMAGILSGILIFSLLILGLAAATSGRSPMVGTFFVFLTAILSFLIVVKKIRETLQGRSSAWNAVLNVVLLVILVIGVTLAVTKINQADAGLNGEIPVTAQEMGITEQSDVTQDYARTKSSALLRYTEASQVIIKEDGTYTPILSYEMVEGRVMGVDGIVLSHYLDRMSSSARKDENGDIVSVKYKQIPEGPWLAEKAWQMTDGTIDFNVYLILYENTLIELGAQEALTEEQMHLFGSSLLK